MRERHPELTWAVEFRGQGADDLSLSPTQGRDVVTLSLHAEPNDPWQKGFAAAERLLLEAGGRPHWGKLARVERDRRGEALSKAGRVRGPPRGARSEGPAGERVPPPLLP